MEITYLGEKLTKQGEYIDPSNAEGITSMFAPIKAKDPSLFILSYQTKYPMYMGCNLKKDLKKLKKLMKGYGCTADWSIILISNLPCGDLAWVLEVVSS